MKSTHGILIISYYFSRRNPYEEHLKPKLKIQEVKKQGIPQLDNDMVLAFSNSKETLVGELHFVLLWGALTFV